MTLASSLQGKYRRRLTVYAMLASLCVIFSALGRSNYINLIVLGAMAFGVPTFDYQYMLGVFVVCMPFLNNNAVIVICITLIDGLFLLKHKMKMTQRMGLELILLCFGVFLAFVFGVDASLNSAYLMIIVASLYGVTSSFDTKEEVDVAIHAFIFSGLAVVGFVVVRMLSGYNVYLYRRLAFEGSIRALANACVIPLMFILMPIVSNEKKITVKEIVGGLILATALLLTTARGSIYALVAAFAVTFLFSSRKGNFLRRLLVLVVFGVVLWYFVSHNNTINFDRVFEDEGGGFHGRTSIWNNLYTVMESKGWYRIIFGLGPGNIKRFSDGMYYTHSSFLDIFFSYGVMGMLFLAHMLFDLLVKALRSKSVATLAVTVGILTNYLTHGTAVNIPMFVTLGLASAISRIMNEELEGV